MHIILNELNEIELEAFRQYKHALIHIGVDFEREDVQQTIVSCVGNMEDAFQAAIDYWFTGKMEYPSAFLIKALNEGWKPYKWNDDWLNHPDLKNVCLKWWEEAEVGLAGYRNVLIADVTEDNKGNQYIVFTNGKEMGLNTARRIGWQRILDYGREQGIID